MEIYKLKDVGFSCPKRQPLSMQTVPCRRVDCCFLIKHMLLLFAFALRRLTQSSTVEEGLVLTVD